MKWNKRCLSRSIAVLCLVLLIFDSRVILEGVRTGMELCLKTVIPSLFPFFVISLVLINTSNDRISRLSQVLMRILKIPETAASVLIPSFLGGYPVGAKCVGDLYHREQISKGEADRLLTFCSNAGPSFLFGILSQFFSDRKLIWMLWIIHILSAVLTAMIIPVKKTDFVSQPRMQISEKSILLAAARAMCIVCCWVVLFRGIIHFLNSWFCWCLPVWTQVCLTGILELTNGCCQLSLISDVGVRFVLCSCLLAFGGVCVLLQTASVTEGLSLWCYMKGKMIQTLFSLWLSCTIVFDKNIIFAGFLPILLMLLRKIQNRYRNPRVIPV